MTDTELRERVARIANEICGCATPEQRRRDKAAARHDAIVMAFKKKVRQALAGDDHGHR